MNSHVNPEAHSIGLVTVAQMIDRATEALAKRPLHENDVAWAKGCLERGVVSLDAILTSQATLRA